MTLSAGLPVDAGVSEREERKRVMAGTVLRVVSDDGALVARLAGADEEEACAALVNIRGVFAERLVEVAAYLVGGGAEVEARDLVDELFTDLWERRSRLVVQSNLRAYLERAIEHRALNALRSAARRRRREAEWVDEAVVHAEGHRPTPSGEVAVEGDVQARLEAAEIRAAVLEAVRALPERQRQVFQRRCIEGMPFRAIADALGMQEQTARNHFSRVMAAFCRRFAWLCSESHPDT